MYPLLVENLDKFQNFNSISFNRKTVLQPLIDYIQSKVKNNLSINLNFICTHNSRRSQLAQVWGMINEKIFS